MSTLLEEVTRVQLAAATTEVTSVVVVLAAETSAKEVVVLRDINALCVEDAEGRAALAEKEELKRVSRVDVETAAMLASTHEDAAAFTQKIALLEGEIASERREQFEELTLLQTRGSKLCHTIVGPPWTRHHLS
jgi:hypothetical protein